MEAKQINYNKQHDTLSFTLKNIDYSIANAFRRVLFSEIPIYAFDNFVIEKNKSAYIDEYITQRIMMIPVNNRLVNPQSLPEFYLDVQGNHNEVIEIWSDKIETSDKKDYIAYPGMIVKLRGDNNKVEELKIKMNVKEGIGRDHAKWSPVSISTYEIIDPTSFKFLIEGKNIMNLDDLVRKAAQVIIGKLNVIKDSLDNPETTKIYIRNLNKANLYEILLNDENHTIGNLITTHIRLNFLNGISNIGYQMPHPLEEKIIIKIDCIDPKKILLDTIDKLVDKFTKFYDSFR